LKDEGKEHKETPHRQNPKMKKGLPRSFHFVSPYVGKKRQGSFTQGLRKAGIFESQGF
jgi:hypothetical protein